MSNQNIFEQERLEILNNYQQLKHSLDNFETSEEARDYIRSFERGKMYTPHIFKILLRNKKSVGPKKEAKKVEENKKVENVNSSFCDKSLMSLNVYSKSPNTINTNTNNTNNIIAKDYKILKKIYTKNKFSPKKATQLLKTFTLPEVIHSLKYLSQNDLSADLLEWDPTIKIPDKFLLITEAFPNYISGFIDIFKEKYNEPGKFCDNFNFLISERINDRVLDILDTDRKNRILCHQYWCEDDSEEKECVEYEKFLNLIKLNDKRMANKIESVVEKEKKNARINFNNFLNFNGKEIDKNYVEFDVCLKYSKVDVEIDGEVKTLSFKDFLSLLL